MISAVVLAAGKSERMGQNKLLLPLAGKPLLVWVLDAVCQTSIEDIVVVTGRDSEAVNRQVAVYPVKVVYNEAYRSGQASSIACGIRALDSRSRCCFFFMADQPLIDCSLIEFMINSFQPGKILQPTYRGKVGAPVLFDACYYEALKQITGDRGGRQVIRANMRNVNHIDWPNHQQFLDIDDKDDLSAISQLINAQFKEESNE